LAGKANKKPRNGWPAESGREQNQAFARSRPDKRIVSEGRKESDSAMIVQACQHDVRHKHGKNKCGTPRFKCALCGKTFVEETALGNMRVSMDQAAMALSLMLEECLSDPSSV